MKVVIDNRIPFIRGLLEAEAKVSYLDGNEIGKKDIIDADAIIIRTRTKADKNLLEGTSVKYVGSATIGTDHIDKEWCNQYGIHCASSPGCNAGSVNQYILSALTVLQNKFNYKTGNTTIGIIGVGNVGTKVAFSASLLGYKVLLNDPPRERREGPGIFVSLEEITEKADIISVHVPLSMAGQDSTHYLINSNLLDKAKNGVIIINTSRGGVVNEEALLNSLNNSKVKASVTDVWESEPDINMELLQKSTIATPHIAGYSLDGKLKATSMILEDFARYFNLPDNIKYLGNLPPPDSAIIRLKLSPDIYSIIGKAILQTYPIMDDHNLLLKNPESFEEIRNSYGVRREFDSYTIINAPTGAKEILGKLGFIV